MTVRSETSETIMENSNFEKIKKAPDFLSIDHSEKDHKSYLDETADFVKINSS